MKTVCVTPKSPTLSPNPKTLCSRGAGLVSRSLPGELLDWRPPCGRQGSSFKAGSLDLVYIVVYGRVPLHIIAYRSILWCIIVCYCRISRQIIVFQSISWYTTAAYTLYYSILRRSKVYCNLPSYLAAYFCP